MAKITGTGKIEGTLERDNDGRVLLDGFDVQCPVLESRFSHIMKDARSATYTLTFRVKGYYSPAVFTLLNGDPGWPEEYEDERSTIEFSVKPEGYPIELLAVEWLTSLDKELEDCIYEAEYEDDDWY